MEDTSRVENRFVINPDKRHLLDYLIDQLIDMIPSDQYYKYEEYIEVLHEALYSWSLSLSLFTTVMKKVISLGYDLLILRELAPIMHHLHRFYEVVGDDPYKVAIPRGDIPTYELRRFIADVVESGKYDHLINGYLYHDSAITDTIREILIGEGNDSDGVNDTNTISILILALVRVLGRTIRQDILTSEDIEVNREIIDRLDTLHNDYDAIIAREFINNLRKYWNWHMGDSYRDREIIRQSDRCRSSIMNMYRSRLMADSYPDREIIRHSDSSRSPIMTGSRSRLMAEEEPVMLSRAPTRSRSPIMTRSRSRLMAENARRRPVARSPSPVRYEPPILTTRRPVTRSMTRAMNRDMNS